MKKFDFSKLSEKQKRIFYYLGIFICIIFIVFVYRCTIEKVCEVDFINKIVRHDITITTANSVIVAEVVDTKSSKELGLSGRDKMRENEGMLFVFDNPGKYGFWMKDMNFDLDIIWINQSGVVVHIEENLSKDSYPKTFQNNIDANFVLELNAGGASRNGIFLGSKLKMSN